MAKRVERAKVDVVLQRPDVAVGVDDIESARVDSPEIKAKVQLFARGQGSAADHVGAGPGCRCSG